MWSRRIVWAVAAAVVLLAIVLTAGAGLLDDVPLLDPTAAVVVQLLAVAALVGSWARWDRRWLLHTLPLLWVLASVLTVAAAVLVHWTGLIRDSYPPAFPLWFALAVAAVAGVPLALARTGPMHRVAAVSAVPLTLASLLLLANQVYAVWPNAGDLFGHTDALRGNRLNRTLRAPPPAVRDKGVLAAYDMPAGASRFAHRPGYVYLPPAYFTDARADLPVLVMLAGVPGWPSQWPQAGRAVTTASGYAGDHDGVAPVLVFVDQNGGTYQDTECVDGPMGNSETFLAADVPAFVEHTLHIPHAPAKWGIVGFSEGGTCAANLAFGHPDVYGHLVDIGGEPRPTFGGPHTTLMTLYGGSVVAQRTHDPVHQLATHQYDGASAWFAAGVDDHRGVATARELARASAAAGITAHEFTGDGGHNWRFASTAFATVLPPLGHDLGIR